MRLTILLICLLASLAISAQDKALLKYKHLFNEAENANKNVVLVFGHKYCGWCRVFDNYHADPSVKSILDKDYFIYKIDILDSKKGEKLFSQYELPGTPAWMIYNSEMDILSNGKNEDGQIIGYPYKPSEIELYLEVIRKTSNHINETELKTLGNKLLEFGDSREKKKNGS